MAKAVRRGALRRQSASVAAAPAIPEDAGFFLNRELSLLSFFRRILEEAQDDRIPLLERIKFLAIVG